MIVNDHEAKRTIDTETGVYLTLNGGSPVESITALKISDGKTDIYIDSYRWIARIEDKLHSMDYRLDTPATFSGPARRRGYLPLICRLIEGHGYIYGIHAERFGRVVVSVEATDRFRIPFEVWELQAVRGA
jgi:hypothetical protein